MSSNKKLLEVLKSALDHIKSVQDDITKLNHDSMTLLNDAIFEADVDISDDGFVALQHQDILTQQLSATTELIEMIKNHINESSDEELVKKIDSSLKEAKAKKDAFSGNAFEQKHEDLVELF